MTGYIVHFVNSLILKNTKKIGHFWWNNHKEAKLIQEGLSATLCLKKNKQMTYFISPCLNQSKTNE